VQNIRRSFDYTEKNQLKEQVRGYQRWVRRLVREGWKPYEISLMFNQLPGSERAILEQMKKEMYGLYPKLVTKFHRNPRSVAGRRCLPRMMLFPDLPAFKHDKKSIDDVSINDGLHYGGIALTAPVSRCRTDLDVLIEDDLDKYTTETLNRIFVTPITHAEEHVVDYVMKSIKRGRVWQDDIVLLPRAVSELPDRSQMAPRRSETRYQTCT
jgi:hypothetical protein